MTRWQDGPLVGYDCESTSADPLTARPVSFAFVLHTPGELIKVDHQLVNPGIEIPSDATEIHGITNEMVADAMPVDEAVRYCIGKIKRLSSEGFPIVTMNGSFDFTILDRQALRLGFEGLADWSGPALDIFVIDRAVDKWRSGGRKLTDLVTTYGVTTPGDAHNAVWDATMSVMVLREMVKKFKAVRFRSVEELHALQVTWRHEQQVDLSEYLVKKEGREPFDPREFGWPIYGPD